MNFLTLGIVSRIDSGTLTDLDFLEGTARRAELVILLMKIPYVPSVKSNFLIYFIFFVLYTIRLFTYTLY